MHRFSRSPYCYFLLLLAAIILHSCDRVRPASLAGAVAEMERADIKPPSDEENADELFRDAQYRESIRNRDSAIAVYEKLLANYPQTGHKAQVFERLGMLHIEFAQSSRERFDAEKMKKAHYYFEQGAALPELNEYTVACKCSLKFLRRDRTEQTAALNEELANLDLDRIVPAYQGPYEDFHNPTSYGAKLDRARSKVLMSLKQIQIRPKPHSDRDTTATPVDDPVADFGLRPLFRGMRSDDTAIRSRAVNTLIGLRAAIAANLNDILHDPKAPGLSKAAALLLVGRLGLVECKDAVESLGDWSWDSAEMRRSDPSYGYSASGCLSDGFQHGDEIYAMSAKRAADKAAWPAHCISTPVSATPLDNYPQLGVALDQLRSNDLKLTAKAKDELIKWSEQIEESATSPLISSESIYSPEIRVAATHLLGEFRVRKGYLYICDLLALAPVDSDTQYTTSLEVRHPAAQDSFTRALIKIGRRVSASEYISDIYDDRYSSDVREKIIRVARAIHGEADMRAKYDEQLASLNKAFNIPPEAIERHDYLVRTLESVEHLF